MQKIVSSLFALICVCALSQTAYADSKSPVITINPDGSVTVVGDMPTLAGEGQDAPPLPLPSPAAVEIVSPVEEPFAPAETVVETAVVEEIPEKTLPPLPKMKPRFASAKEEKKKANALDVIAAPVEQNQPPEPVAPGQVSREEARKIALSVAPPSRGVDVYPADYNGQKVYQVVFKTEEGEQYVLVDRQNGEIVTEKKGKRK